MIRRLHAAAPTILLCGTAVLVSLTAVAQAAKVDLVTAGEMHRFVIITFLTGAATALAGLTVVFSMVTNSRDSEMRAAITANTSAVASLVQMFKEHHLDKDAHPAGSAARLDPLHEKLDGLTEGQHALGVKLERLYSEHRVIRSTEACLLQTRTERRNPEDSPAPRRASDPEGFDGVRLRGLEPTNDAEEEPEDEA